MTNTEIAEANRKRYVQHVQQLRNKSKVVPANKIRKQRTRAGAQRAAVRESIVG